LQAALISRFGRCNCAYNAALITDEFVDMDFLRHLLMPVFFAAVLTIAACGSGGGNDNDTTAPPANPPQAVMSISALPQLTNPVPTPENVVEIFLAAFNLAYDAGARGQMTTFHWNDLEPQVGNYDAHELESLNGAITNAISHDMTQFVGIQMINTNQREMPAEFSNSAFDNATVMTRFNLLLDRVITPNIGKIKYLSIGNEVDAYLRAHPAEWAKYKTFYDAAVEHAHSLDPDILVGVTATAEGALTLSTSPLQDLNEHSDVIILTYYPIDFSGDGTVTVRTPQSPATDFPDMLNFAGTRPLVLQEVGYPASPLNNSSEAMQSAFIESVYDTWRSNAADIPFLNFFVLHDFTAQMCAEFTSYYGAAGLGNSESFGAYLCTLGFRRDDGTPRQAWSTLQQQTEQADFIVK